MARRLQFRFNQSPGDTTVGTASVRDLHIAHPGQFVTDVRGTAPELWENNPYITHLKDGEPGVEVIDMHYPAVHQSNQRPGHFITGFAQYLEERLGLRVPVTQFRGDIHLSPAEKAAPPRLGFTLPTVFWLIVAGGKFDFTAKWWNPANFQRVVDFFQGTIQFIQVGEAGHWHLPLQGVLNLVGKTTIRQLVHLMHYAEGVVCPVTFAMHLCAGVETRPGRPKNRPCVVIAGGREPTHWEAYPHHRYISLVGALNCCAEGGCWKSRCQPVGDGDPKDHHDLCEQPVQITPDLRVPKCMDMITADEVIRQIQTYYQGGALQFRPTDSVAQTGLCEIQPATNGVYDVGRQTCREPKIAIPAPPEIPAGGSWQSVTFYHGLGDCVHFALLIPLYVRRGHRIEVECTRDKAILFEAAGATAVSAGALRVHHWGYPSGWTHLGHGQFWQGSKLAHNLSEPPLPHIGAKSDLWGEYVASRVDVLSRLSTNAVEMVDRWLERLPRPVVLLHSRGNTSQDRKSLPNETAEAFYREFINRCDGTLVLLDWDNRVPRLASGRVRHLSDFGTCPLESLLAMIDRADLMIGIDSGPLHCARFTNTPTLGVWMPGHYPSTYSLPRREQVNVVLHEHTQQWNRYKRIPWNIVEHPGTEFDASRLADLCGQMLSKPRYLEPVDIASDVQLRQFVQEFCRWHSGSSNLAAFWDRNRGFDVILRELTARFSHGPTIVETGTIRSEEDWAGAGFATYLFGTYVHRRGGRLHSVDLSSANVAFARAWTQIFGDAVTVHERDSLSFLSEFPGNNIDLLYLDSLDTTEPRHAEHAFRELELILPKLNARSLVVFDDTPWNGGAFTGKGALAVPWLIERGWRVLYAGYQVIMEKHNG